MSGAFFKEHPRPFQRVQGHRGPRRQKRSMRSVNTDRPTGAVPRHLVFVQPLPSLMSLFPTVPETFLPPDTGNAKMGETP